jgi:hypothetical protein
MKDNGGGRDRALVAGWAFMAAAAVVIVAGYMGLRTQPDVLGQVPYIMSGGVGGLGLLIAGGICISWAGMTKGYDRYQRLEQALIALEEEVLEEIDALRADLDSGIRHGSPARTPADV